MWKFAVILLLVALLGFVHAEDEQPTKDAPRSPWLVETVLCYTSPKPWDCVKEQAGRMLNHLDLTVEEKKRELMVEADEEMKESETSRGLSDEEKQQSPSQLIGALDRGFSALANILTDDSNSQQGRESRALSKAQNKQVSDDTNDFNDDFNIYEAFRDEAEGKLIEESRGKIGHEEDKHKGGKQTESVHSYQKQSYQGPYGGSIINDDDDDGYGIGGYRGKYKGKGKKGKKGKKKGLMKLFFFGAVLKSKIELLLKVLSFHLQLKFFAVAVAGLIINLARLWIDLKKAPQKHHYEDHDDWGSSWKRQSENQQEGVFAHRLAYNNQQYPQQQQR